MNRGWLRIALIGSFLALLAGCTQPLAENQRVLLDRGREAYDKKLYQQAAESLSQFLSSTRDRPEVATAYYLRGQSYALLNRRIEAMADLQRCIDTPGDPESTWRAYVVLGTMHFEDGRWEQARVACSAAAKRMPGEPPKDAVLLRLGQCLERQGRWDEAQTVFREITRAFRGGTAVAAATRRVNLKPRHFSVQCGSFGDARNAEKLAGQLGQRGHPAYILKETRPGGPAHIVLVGRSATYEDALKTLTRVRPDAPDAVLWP